MLLSERNPDSLSMFRSRATPSMMRASDNRMVGSEAGEMVLPSVERPLAFCTKLAKDHPHIKMNKGAVLDE